MPGERPPSYSEFDSNPKQPSAPPASSSSSNPGTSSAGYQNTYESYQNMVNGEKQAQAEYFRQQDDHLHPSNNSNNGGFTSPSGYSPFPNPSASTPSSSSTSTSNHHNTAEIPYNPQAPPVYSSSQYSNSYQHSYGGPALPVQQQQHGQYHQIPSDDFNNTNNDMTGGSPLNPNNSNNTSHVYPMDMSADVMARTFFKDVKADVVDKKDFSLQGMISTAFDIHAYVSVLYFTFIDFPFALGSFLIVFIPFCIGVPMLIILPVGLLILFIWSLIMRALVGVDLLLNKLLPGISNKNEYPALILIPSGTAHNVGHPNYSKGAIQVARKYITDPGHIRVMLYFVVFNFLRAIMSFCIVVFLNALIASPFYPEANVSLGFIVLDSFILKLPVAVVCFFVVLNVARSLGELKRHMSCAFIGSEVRYKIESQEV
eukprot:Nk52_evm1s2283 gene=Nk52_evmTU1s2283